MAVDILDILKDRYAGEEPEPALDLNQMLASGAKIERAPVPEPSFMQYLTSDIKALPETALTVGSGLVSEALAGWAGLGAGTALDLARFLAPDTMDVIGTAFPALGKDSMRFAEDVMDVVRKYGSWQPRSPRAQKQTEMIMWPFEKIRESSDYWGKKVSEATGRPELGAAVAVAIEGATIFAGPKLGKSGYAISKGNLLKLRRKIGTAARTGNFKSPGLVKTAQDILAEAKNDPAMVADIQQYMKEQGAMPPADLSFAYRNALLAEESRLGRTLTQAEVNAVVEAVDQGRLGPPTEPSTPPGMGRPGAPSAPPAAIAPSEGVEATVYHGTGVPLRGGIVEEKMSFSPDRSVAEAYAKERGKIEGNRPRMYRAQIRFDNPKIIRNEDRVGFSWYNEAKAAGHDGVVITEKGEPIEYVVINPSTIKRIAGRRPKLGGPVSIPGVDEAIAAAIERRGGPIESFKLAGEEAAARVEELRRNPLPYVGDAAEFMRRAEQALGHKFVPELSPFREKAAELNVRYRGPQEAVDGEVVHKFYDPQTGEYFTAGSAESAAGELEAHRAAVTGNAAKYADVKIEDYAREVQRWWAGEDVDINQVKEDIRTFLNEKPRDSFETAGDYLDFIERGEELLGIVNKGIRERGTVVEPTIRRKYNTVQEEIDRFEDKLEARGVPFEEWMQNRELNELYDERNRIGQRDLERSYNEIFTAVRKASGESPALVKKVINDVYSIDPENTTTGQYFAGEYTEQQVRNRASSREQIFEMVKRDYGEINDLDMEGIFSNISGLTLRGQRKLLENLTDRAAKIETAVHRYFYEGGEPAPTVEPIPQSVDAAKAEFNDGNISEPKTVKPEDRIAYMKEFNRKRSQLKQEQIEAALEEGYDISDMLPDEAQDAYRSFQDYYERSMESSEPRGIGEIYNDMKTLFEGEEGSIYIGEEARTKLTNLTHEQREALQRLVADAKRMVGDFSDYLRDIGLDEKQVAFIRNQINQVRKTEPETFGEVRQHWIDARAIAQGDKIVKQRKPGRGRQSTPVYESERNMMIEAKELSKPVNEKVGLENPLRTIERADPDGTGLKEVYYDYREAEQLFRREWGQVKEEIKQMKKGIGWKSRKRIGAYAIAQQERGANILARMKIEVPELTGAEMGIYENLRGRYEALFERINTMREMIGKEPLEKVDNYFTFFRTFNILEKAGIKTNPLLEKPNIVTKRYNSYSSTPFKYGIERIKKGAMPVELDPFFLYESYAENALRHLHLSPWVAKMNELMLTLPDPKTGKMTWKLSRQKPNLYNFLRNWVNHVSGRPAFQLSRQVDRGLSIISQNLAYSVLGANFRSAMIQVTALRNTVGEIGFRCTLDGVKMTLEDCTGLTKNRQFALKHSKVLDGRTFDVAIEDAMRMVRGGRIGGMYRALGRGALKPLQWLDMETAISTWNGAFKLAKDRGMNLRRAANFADDVVTRTQASALPGDLAPIQRSAAGKAFTLFQTFVINDWGFLTKDVLGIGNPKITSDIALKKVMRYVIATTLFNLLLEEAVGIQSPFPTPIRDVSESVSEGDPLHVTIRKTAFGLLDPVPIVGSARYGKGPGGPVWELGQEAVKSISGAPMAKPLPEIGGKIAGVPGTSQVGKMIRAGKRGETPYGILIGRYTPSKRARRRRNPLGGLKGLEGLRGL